MDKFVHIVFGDSAAGLLKYFFHCIQNDFKSEIINVRDDYYLDIEKDLIGIYDNIKNINSDSKVVIWYGENTGDQAGLRYLHIQIKPYISISLKNANNV